tara:strand:+ start:1052 stop:3016 length:1965 start_codon:yes stop_codon:yes gene_type:complete
MKYLLPALLLSCTSLNAAGLEESLDQLSAHLNKREALTPEELSGVEADIIKQGSALAKDIRLVTKALDVVSAYDEIHQPLFLNEETKGGFSRRDRKGKELEHAIFQLQQALLDHAYHLENVKDHSRDLDSRAFQCADFFPGKVDPPRDPRKVYKIKIDASQLPPDGAPLTTDDAPARRCTGWYVAPGTIAELKVPSGIVKKGYGIRVGAHSWDLAKKPVIKRLDRISIVYPIKQDRILITHPLGGGVYLEVPPDGDGGICDIYARNIVEAPFYSARSFDKTTLQDWLRVERKKSAPWADFESEKFMMQVPTAWIYNYKTPDKLTADYDKCMDLISEITGRSKVRSKVVLYHQIDVIMRGGAFFPGYPQSNYNWNPLEKENGNKDHWFLKGPQFAKHELFHEMGHMERITKFKGETEALVNFPYVYIHNQGFEVDLDVAFSRSMGRGDNVSIERAAVDRMITENFRKGKPRNTTNRPGDEVKYQHRGYGHYGDMAKLFGWDPLLRFAAEDHENYRKGKGFPANVNDDPTDGRILRFCMATGYDLRPLFEFWGVYPEDESSLARAIKRNDLSPSPAVYERLKHYRTLIPMTASEFKKHALIMYPRCENPGRTLMEMNTLFGHGFYHKWLSVYNDSHGEAAVTALDNIIAKHFPDAR